MGFLRKLLGFGTTVAGTVAAVKVTEKVKENNPDGGSRRRPRLSWPTPRRRGPSFTRTPRRR